jgi:hypothetical protein
MKQLKMLKRLLIIFSLVMIPTSALTQLSTQCQVLLSQCRDTVLVQKTAIEEQKKELELKNIKINEIENLRKQEKESSRNYKIAVGVLSIIILGLAAK